MIIIENHEFLLLPFLNFYNAAEELEEKLKSLMITRDSKWVSSTVDKLKILIDRVSHVINHSNWKVRQAIVNWASQLLLESTQYVCLYLL